MNRSLVVAAFGLALSACSATGKTPIPLPFLDAGPTPGTVVDAGRYTLTVLAPGTSLASCDPHASAADAGILFTNVTNQWGIAADSGLPLQGTAFVAADLDEDGYPDLIVTNGFNVWSSGRETIPTTVNGIAQNLPDGGLSIAFALLMNRPGPDGGRIFVDETQASGIAQIRGGSTTQFRDISVLTVGDVDGDGTPDVYTSIVGPRFDAGYNDDVNEVMLNDGTGHFSFATQSDTSLCKYDWFPQGLTMTDVDNDGRLDVYATFWYDNNHTYFGSQQQLYRGNGDGTFVTVTQDAGLDLTNYDGPQYELPPKNALDAFFAGRGSHPAQGIVACDLNGDGYPELVESSYGQQWNTLYQNDGTGSFFTEIAADAGYAGDNDRDYHDNQYFLCYCSDPSNKTNPDCKGVARPGIECPTPLTENWTPELDEAAANLNGNGFTAVCRDMFGRGQNDLFTANIKHWWDGQSIDQSQLLRNAGADGGIAFQRIDNADDGLVDPHLDPEGWNEGNQGALATDFDNDGRPDILVGQSDYAYQRALMFIQQANGTFAEHALDWGVNFPCAIGLATADFDRDGDMDLVFGGSLARNCTDPVSQGGGAYTTAVVQVFENNASQFANWLEIRLKGDGVKTNSMGIGARVTITVNGATQMQEMGSTFGHAAFGDDIGMLFWGLGNCPNVDSIQVRWPNKSLSTETWTNVPAGNFIELRQGDPVLYKINLPR
jgi:hypothetical protein